MVIDTHAHFLPGLDDGSKDQAMTEAMLRLAAARGCSRCRPMWSNSLCFLKGVESHIFKERGYLLQLNGGAVFSQLK